MKRRRLNSKNIFLFDAFGALVSFILLAGVLPFFYQWIGLPIGVLFYLAAYAALCGSYSLYCHHFTDRSRKWLRVIMAANFLYCLIIAAALAMYRQHVTTWGLLYFVGDIVVILAVIATERKVYLRSR